MSLDSDGQGLAEAESDNKGRATHCVASVNKAGWCPLSSPGLFADHEANFNLVAVFAHSSAVLGTKLFLPVIVSQP